MLSLETQALWAAQIGSIAVPVKEEQVGNMQWSDWEGLFEEVVLELQGTADSAAVLGPP